MPECLTCGVSVAKKPLFRNAPKGVPAKWSCEDCMIIKPEKDQFLKTLEDFAYSRKPARSD